MGYATLSNVTKSAVLERLQELRQENKRPAAYTLAWLARELEVDRSLLYRWLSGQRTMDPYRRQQIAGLLGMDPEAVRPRAQAKEAA